MDLLAAFTGDLFESRCVRQGSGAPALPGPSCYLKLAPHSTDARALDSQALGPELTCQEQARAAGFDTVDCVTGYILEYAPGGPP